MSVATVVDAPALGQYLDAEARERARARLARSSRDLRIAEAGYRLLRYAVGHLVLAAPDAWREILGGWLEDVDAEAVAAELVVEAAQHSRSGVSR